ncbi:T9SS type A sorting domain-containing protein [bacterium]|nr:T9SS type A sorting domain-containing protein [bacterium]
MKSMATCFFLLFCILLLPEFQAQGQGNIFWSEEWKHSVPAQPQPAQPFGWMYDSLGFTALAYDEVRDVVYVVSPQFIIDPVLGLLPQPRIYILDADSGGVRMDMGRSAFHGAMGAGGELPLPLDTFTVSAAKPLGFMRNRMCVYRIDVDDEGRIYACNLVNPLWGYCKPVGATTVCDPDYLEQGPLRVWRWDTPSSTPQLIYATSNTSASAIGDAQDSELPATRWADAFSVSGKRGWYDPPGPSPPVQYDSVRIYIGGGNWPGQVTPNNEVVVLVEDRRPAAQRPDRDVQGGGKLSFRLGLRIRAPFAHALHGVAAEPLQHANGQLSGRVWMDGNFDSTAYTLQVQYDNQSLPQLYVPLAANVVSLSPALTGLSGALGYFELPQYGLKYLIATDGAGCTPNIPDGDNDLTHARIVDVTHPGQEFQVWGDSPQLGRNRLASIDNENGISDVDYRFKQYSPEENPSEPGTYFEFFVLMSKNGIARFQGRIPIPRPAVDLSAFTATALDGSVQLRWRVESENASLRFAVQRADSREGPWKEIGSVATRGTTHEAAWYEFIDTLDGTASTRNKLWYRLVEEDVYGYRSEFRALRVSLVTAAHTPAITLYPHPVQQKDGTLQLELRNEREERAVLRVWDLLGRSRFVMSGIQLVDGIVQMQVPVATLPPGIYMLVVRTDNGGTMTQRLIVR